MTRPPRKLIPDDQCIVVFDTTPVRALAEQPTLPSWVATFAKMSRDGYSFSLADNAPTELLNQRIKNGLDDADLRTIVGALAQFLNPNVPVLPGKRDLMSMIGESDDPAWSEAEAAAFAQAGWTVLKDPTLLDDDSRKKLAKALQEDRDDWIETFETFDAIRSKWLDQDPEGEAKNPLDQYKHPILSAALADIASRGKSQSPTMAERQDLVMRYLWRQWVRTRKSVQPYDPSNDSKINDGIDFDLYHYLTLPAYVVATEKGFHGAIEDIKVPQRDWFWKPEELAAAWERGERPRPTWKDERTDSSK
ncbi:hypothetical protein A8F16_04270 [Burkholderia cenocepacia]|uniref:hypothetical protein n=1 Tax=Burkholderia cenocepacia TaxID=95486 RepID=UPI0009811B60|nr:hypothetical protein [Burkholderia cenocepacia]ONX70739.1 hypothetical protein A8F16_04270 [Burkholderia cenocepacia]ONX90433.1 hypothetical protein A8F19_12595 [Burkholderia cenocepacia]